MLKAKRQEREKEHDAQISDCSGPIGRMPSIPKGIVISCSSSWQLLSALALRRAQNSQICEARECCVG